MEVLPNSPAKTSRRMREADEGNALWQCWLDLTRNEQRTLKVDLQANGISRGTFNQDTKATRPLSGLPFGRLDWYRQWFEDHGKKFDLFALARAPVFSPSN